MSASAIYEGTVRHRRHAPVEHSFEYRSAMLLLDLDELPELLDSIALWSARRPAPGRFRASDYMTAAQARELAGTDGAVTLLAQPRILGHGFNPLAVYYCYDAAGEPPAAIVAEVRNTPWGERHRYVLDGDMNDSVAKSFHVSPFMGMSQTYDFRVTAPGERIVVHITTTQDGAQVFDATLSLERREWSRAALALLLLKPSAMTLRTSALIYWNALRLWRKGAPYAPHPSGRPWHARLTARGPR